MEKKEPFWAQRENPQHALICPIASNQKGLRFGVALFDLKFDLTHFEYATFSAPKRYFCRMRTLIFLLLLAGCSTAFAQQPDSLPAPLPDTLALRIDTAAQQASSTTIAPKEKRPGLIRRIWNKNYPNPKTAAFLSLALPGAGQAYNKHWWKMPIVYAVLGGVTYFEIDNIREYHRLRDNYKLLVDGDPNTNPTEAPYNQIDAIAMKQYRDQWKRYVEQTSLVLGLAYVLTATEAFVGAHLARFDVSDDLSFKVQPKFQVSPYSSPVLGLGLTFQLGK